MALFGQPNPQTQSSVGFGTVNQQQQGGLFGSQPQQTNPLFGSAAQKPTQSGLFGGLGQQPQPQPQPQPQQQQQQQQSSPFGALGSNTQQPQGQQTGGLFSGLGASTQQQPQQPQQQTQGTGLFPGQQPQQQGGLFSGLGTNSQAQTGGLPGLGSATQSQQPQQPSQFQLGQTLPQSQANGSTIWTPGQGMTGGESSRSQILPELRLFPLI